MESEHATGCSEDRCIESEVDPCVDYRDDAAQGVTKMPVIEEVDLHEYCDDDVVQNWNYFMKATERKEMLVVYEHQIGIALRSRSLCAQARIARKMRKG